MDANIVIFLFIIVGVKSVSHSESRVVSVSVDHYVIINLRQDGQVISTKETKGASGANAVWNAPFLFDLPSGDISRLPLLLEIIVMQVRRVSQFRHMYKSSTAIFVAIANNTLYGSKLYIFILCQKSLGY